MLLGSLRKFTGYTHGLEIYLTELALASRNIKLLEDGVFHYLFGVKFIDLSYNKLEYLQPDTFVDCTSMRILLLQNNRLRDIGMWVFKMTRKLERLDLDENQMNVLRRGL